MASSGLRSLPAIVLGSGPTGLGILRCLQMAGIPAFVACPAGDQVTRSRWYRPTPGTPWGGVLGATGLSALQAMPLDEAVLIPGADDAALWLADLPGHGLAHRFHISSSSRATLEVLQDKVLFDSFLNETDVPHPRTFYVEFDADIDAIPFEELDRVFIKPANSQVFSDVTGAKGIWVAGREELRRYWSDLHGQGFKLMVQEYVPGQADEHYFVDGFRDRDGRLTGLFARRRARIHPPDFGNSSYSCSIPLSDIEEPVANMHTILGALDYRGIFSAEFKRDARDGSFRILEVNSRAWTYVEFAARCGVNVCEMAYDDALGQPVATAGHDYPLGEGCVDFYRDLKAVREGKSNGDLSLLKVSAQWCRAHFHTFRFDDPRPGLFAARKVVRSLLRSGH